MWYVSKGSAEGPCPTEEGSGGLGTGQVEETQEGKDPLPKATLQVGGGWILFQVFRQTQLLKMDFIISYINDIL